MRLLAPATLILAILAVALTRGPVVEAPEDGHSARRGCCSKHGGVCGCSQGRAKCCDGALSPTCGCVGDNGPDC